MSKKEYIKEEASLETLLDLDGEIFPMDNGYWTKFEARRVHSTEKIPHGIRYSISLHDRNNTRILGFDNAHGYKPEKKKYGASKISGHQQSWGDGDGPWKGPGPPLLVTADF